MNERRMRPNSIARGGVDGRKMARPSRPRKSRSTAVVGGNRLGRPWRSGSRLRRIPENIFPDMEPSGAPGRYGGVCIVSAGHLMAGHLA